MLAATANQVGHTLPRNPSNASARDWKRIVEPVEPFLAQVAACLSAQVATFEPEIARYAQYALTNQGKQLRPALVALSGGAAGKVTEQHVVVAAIIEMVHLATLVHDDIMDGAEMRRRRPTLAANWGNEVSVLLGDCLFAHALQMAAGFPTTEVCRAVSAATKRVCTGEILQTHRRRKFDLTKEDYFQMLEMKTAELFALSCDLGAWLGGANEEDRARLRSYGIALGTAYQIYDDCVDLFGSEAEVGKSLGTDMAKGKLTLPVLLVLEDASDTERGQLKGMVAEWNAESLPDLLALLQRHQALDKSLVYLQNYLGVAKQALLTRAASPGQSALLNLAELLAAQSAALGNVSVPRVA